MPPPCNQSTAGAGPVLKVTGNYEEDLKQVAAFYAQFTPIQPKNFKLPIS